MNFNLNIHRVTSVTVGAVHEHVSENDRYCTRTIEIKTPEGDFELALFSEHVSPDTDEPLLEVKS